METACDKKKIPSIMKNATWREMHNGSWQSITGDGRFTYLSQI